MFTYTVYGIPGVTRREPSRRVEPVSKVEAVRPTERSWVVQKNNAGQPQQTFATQLTVRKQIRASRPVTAVKQGNDESRQSPIGFMYLQDAQPLILEHRLLRPVSTPNFIGRLDQLRQIRLQSQNKTATLKYE